MRLASYRYQGRSSVGLVDPTQRIVTELLNVPTMQTFIEDAGGSPLKLRPAKGADIALSDVTLEAPIPRPRRNIFCVGKNYRAHAQEFARSGFDSSAGSQGEAVPQAPIIFTKAPESVIGPDASVIYPKGVSEALDYEGELAVIIGKAGRAVSKSQALDHVFGYTVLNDVTARDWQERHKQWFLGKSFDTFCPMGPCIVTRDEIDERNLRLRCWINGELRQDANTRDLIFDIPTLISTISAGITLIPETLSRLARRKAWVSASSHRSFCAAAIS
jgi:2-keto-4-pentenoate hydratase/2-oxohepta-3-ene-1,7-dioic acid hydratase in catechol pathway